MMTSPGLWWAVVAPFCGILLVSTQSHAQAEMGCFLQPNKQAVFVSEDWQNQTEDAAAHFRVFWNSIGDSATNAGTVEAVLEGLVRARSTYAQQGFTLPSAAHDPVRIQIQPLNAMGATVPGEALGTGYRSHILIATNFAPWGDSPLALAALTAAHEYFHVLQFAQDYSVVDWAFYEAAAVWAEDQVYPNQQDWITRYAPAFMAQPTLSLDAWGGLRPYGAVIALKYLLAWPGAPNLPQVLQTGSPLWESLIGSLPAADEALASMMSELSHAGQSPPAGVEPLITELALLPGLDRSSLPELTVPQNLAPLSVSLLRSDQTQQFVVFHDLDWASLLVGNDWQARELQNQGLCQSLHLNDLLVLPNAGSQSRSAGLELEECTSLTTLQIRHSADGQWVVLRSTLSSGRWVLYDLRGHRCAGGTITDGGAHVRLTGLASGQYILQTQPGAASTLVLKP